MGANRVGSRAGRGFQGGAHDCTFAAGVNARAQAVANRNRGRAWEGETPLGLGID